MGFALVFLGLGALLKSMVSTKAIVAILCLILGLWLAWSLRSTIQHTFA